MKTIQFALIAATLLAASCSGTSKKTAVEPQDTATVQQDTIKSYSFYGTYEGTLPAADCEGIKTVLSLNEDTTYDLSRKYLGKEDRPFETCGVYNVLENNVVELVEPSSDNRTYYKVIENAVVLSDSVGTVNEGELAEFYVLKKK